MAEPSSKRANTRVSRIVKAERKAVYGAFLDPDSVALWLAPEKMKGHVHTFDAREGGTFRMSLTYQGRFVELVPNERTVEAVVFESRDQAFAGEMKMIVNLADADGV